MSGASRFEWMKHHAVSPHGERLDCGVGCPPSADELEIIGRALRVFRSADIERYYGRDSQWRVFYESKQRATVQTLLEGSVEEAAQILRNLDCNYLCYGFEDLHADVPEAYAIPGQREAYAMHCKILRYAWAKLSACFGWRTRKAGSGATICNCPRMRLFAVFGNARRLHCRFPISIEDCTA